jgi:hypothetical protein
MNNTAMPFNFQHRCLNQNITPKHHNYAQINFESFTVDALT